MPYKNIVLSNAQGVYQQAPKQSQFYIGFSTVNSAAIDSRLYDLELIKQDIINNFNIRRGEKLMNPTYGTIIWDLIMEPLTPEVKDLLTQDIQTICTSDPRVVPTQIDLTEYDNGYILELTLTLTNTDQSTKIKLNFDQEAGLTAQ